MEFPPTYCNIISGYACIGTHDVLYADIEPDIRAIRVQYLLNTRAMGCLLLLMSISNGEVDFSRSMYLTLDRASSENYTLPSLLPSGWYIISVYDIEESGTVHGPVAYPAVSETHYVMGSNQS